MKNSDEYNYDYLRGLIDGYHIQEPIGPDDFPEGFENIDLVYEQMNLINDLLNQAIKTWGKDAQVEMIHEECLESPYESTKPDNPDRHRTG